MVGANFKPGTCYSFEEIEKAEDIIASESYGDEQIGQHAIHLSTENGKDVWFIYDGYNGHGGIFKCVYNV